jgi:hypothetical protein
VIKENSHEQIYTFDGTVCVLFPASLKAPGQTAAEKIEQLKPEFIHRERRLEIYLELFIVFLTAGALLLWIMRFLFNLCVDDWNDLSKRPVEYYDVRHPLCADRCWGGVLCCRSDISDPQFFQLSP